MWGLEPADSAVTALELFKKHVAVTLSPQGDVRL